MAASSFRSTSTVLYLVLFCFVLVHGGRSSPVTWRPMQMMADKNNASGDSSWIKPMSYFPDINKVVHYALCKSKKLEYYGAKGVFTVHPLRMVRRGQASAVEVWASNSENEFIGAGWHVKPELYGDNQVHLFTTWTVDSYNNTGCFNLRCPGFVIQEGSPLTPGSILASVSHMTISIRQVSPLWHWRLFVDDGFVVVEVGHWPNALFTHLDKHADIIRFGGQVEFLRGDGGPSMGSGHFPGDVAASAAIKNLQFFDNRESPVDFELGDQIIKVDVRDCYDAILTPHTKNNTLGLGEGGINFFYGGPSGCKNYS